MTDLKPADLDAIVQSVSEFANEPETVLLDRNMPVLKADLRALLADRARMEKALREIADEEFKGPIGISIHTAAANELLRRKEIARQALGASQ